MKGRDGGIERIRQQRGERAGGRQRKGWEGGKENEGIVGSG